LMMVSMSSLTLVRRLLRFLFMVERWIDEPPYAMGVSRRMRCPQDL
jgi:hypothetical protein